ncbi:hypothetical protein BDW62DRAFT_213385 [Aspergillus aurantiobrunneus]
MVSLGQDRAGNTAQPLPSGSSLGPKSDASMRIPSKNVLGWTRDYKAHEALLVLNESKPCPSHDRNLLNQSDQSLRGRLRSGWKFTLSLASTGSIIVLSFNLGFLLWAVDRDRVKENRGILYQGDCARVRHLSTGLHLLINILSTTLLGGSNYGMQCLCAPTRKDIDRLHGTGKWLDTGVPSLRNLFHVSKIRALLWICLMLSSLPLHLFCNSTIFCTTAAYPYNVFAGRDSLGDEAAPSIEGTAGAGDEYAFERLHQAARNGTLQRLKSSDCVGAYATTYQTSYGDLLLVTDGSNTTDHYDMVAYQKVFDANGHISIAPERDDPYAWLCPPEPKTTCNHYLPDIYSQIDNDNWVVYGGLADYTVASCLSLKLPEHCKLQYSLPLTLIVIATNVVKAAIMLYMSVRNPEPPMLTTGDAVASFLRQPDRTTLGRCLLPGAEVSRVTSQDVSTSLYTPLAYEGRRRWFSTVSFCRWALIFILWPLALLGCTFLLCWAQLQDGEGLLFSILYFIFNSVMTSMALAAEWSRYAVTRRGIRVSWNPQSAQRSSYFLSMPYRYAVPLMVASATLHWLISQSPFLVGIEAYDQMWVRAPDNDLITCGYTPVAVVSAMSVGGFMFLCLVGLAFRKFASGMSVAGSCSLAIAAACHPNYDPNLNEEDQGLDTPEGMEFLPLKWGAVPVQGDLGHCSFSSAEVESPKAVVMYQ